MNTQPEALRLATILQTSGWQPTQQEFLEAAAELRRLHEENERLRQALAQPEQRGYCTCGDSEALGVVHFRTRPCFHYTEPLAQPEQEPVLAGSLSVRYFRGDKAMTDTYFEYLGDLSEGDYTLYTAPPKREWVGLTDEEMKKTWYEMQNIMGWYSFQEISQAVEAKLKEKNSVL